MTLRSGERQVAENVDGIRSDHVERYRWAAGRIPKDGKVHDIACGVGYGSVILAAETKRAVLGWDNCLETIEHARAHFAHPHVAYVCQNVSQRVSWPRCDVLVCFETIEHIADPSYLLRNTRAKRLIASVPNQAIYPFNGQAGHFRHYTKDEFGALLGDCGWSITDWFSQDYPNPAIRKGADGWTLICDAVRA